MKIALFSHSAHLGGAETALLNLAKLIKTAGHGLVVFIPKSKKPQLIGSLKASGAEIDFFSRTTVYGNTSKALSGFSTNDHAELERALISHQPDLVISNSSSFLDAALVSANLNLPHIWSIHEIQHRNPEQPKGGLAAGTFSRWFAALSDHLIFCSASTREAHESELLDKPRSTVLSPFLEIPVAAGAPAHRRTNGVREQVDLMFIGAPTERKNPVFAVEVTAALRARGRDVQLNFIGGRRDQTGLLDGLLRRRGLKSNVNFLGKVVDPYRYFSEGSINLICAKSEPFGLTVPESLIRGIPVLAPNRDGPSELLDSGFLFEPESIEHCIRLIERTVDQYEKSSEMARNIYERWRYRFTLDHQIDLVNAAIAHALSDFKPKTIPFELSKSALDKSIKPDALKLDRIIQSIAIVSDQSETQVALLVQAERDSPGCAVASDITRFDVVPHQASGQMNELYRSGSSFAIELAASYDDPARLEMAAFILLRLCTERSRLGVNLKILAVGDGIGSDSIRLASAGFDVDYMDYDTSITARTAAEMFVQLKVGNEPGMMAPRLRNGSEIEAGTYDAIISLEVIEHVENPREFLEFLNKQLKPTGLLFISECFAGIKPYWQTHLLNNERFAGLLPILAANCGLEFQGINQAPMGKPFVFQKSESPQTELIESVLQDETLMALLVYEQARLIRPKTRNVDKLVYAFKRLIINLRGNLARQKIAFLSNR
jgi:glycosyltransferase involved in cell wall biosynthesis/2-polyprenyl-3-methyl-5-hydroxy-6-metoxy-1,4-benzoquinol methylase